MDSTPPFTLLLAQTVPQELNYEIPSSVGNEFLTYLFTKWVVKRMSQQ